MKKNEKGISKKILLSIFPSLLTILLLNGCANSNITREATNNIDVGVQNTVAGFDSLGDSSFADTFQNSSQTMKGAVMGSAVGAVAGGLTSGVGLFPGMPIGAILGGAYGAYIDANTNLLDRLENRGVKVIVLGDQILIILHSEALFNGMTAVLRPGMYSTLDLISKFINRFTSMTVKVSAYMNPDGPERVDVPLTKEQAESVVRYLWQAGINTRMITAVGMGGMNPVTHASPDWDGGENYRVEITLEKLPV